MNHNHFRAVIFGSSRIKRGDVAYKTIYTLAKNIAEAEIDLVIGGGPGLMDAASRGHHAGKSEKHISTIGLRIKIPQEQKVSYHLDERKDFLRFSQRLDRFMQLAQVVVVAPGGIGTLLELFYTWQLLQVRQICDNVPIILLGETWKGLLDWIRQQPLRKRMLDKKDLENIFLVKTPAEAMQIITKTKELHRQGRNVCVNLKKYK